MVDFEKKRAWKSGKKLIIVVWVIKQKRMEKPGAQ